jgi:hypothetical protein
LRILPTPNSKSEMMMQVDNESYLRSSIQTNKACMTIRSRYEKNLRMRFDKWKKIVKCGRIAESSARK